MSLLADLLSKKNNANPSGGRDIPPTLIRAYAMPTDVRSFKKRYIGLAVVAAVAISVGVFAMSYFVPFSPVSSVKPVSPPQPRAVAVVPAPVVEPAPVPSPDTSQILQTIQTIQDAPAISPEHPRKSRHGAIKPVKRAMAQKAVAAAVAVPESDTAGNIDTTKRDSLLYSARSAEQSGNWTAALAIYRKAIKLDPDNYKIMSNAAAALNNLGMFEEGGKEARQALGKKPDYVPAMINAAIACSATGKSQDALDLFAKASSADPSNRNIAINLGILQERSGKFDDAQKTYRRLADDGDPLALHGMGRIFERAGNKSEAARVYRQILALPNAGAVLKKEVKGSLTRLEE